MFCFFLLFFFLNLGYLITLGTTFTVTALLNLTLFLLLFLLDGDLNKPLLPIELAGGRKGSSCMPSSPPSIYIVNDDGSRGIHEERRREGMQGRVGGVNWGYPQ